MIDKLRNKIQIKINQITDMAEDITGYEMDECVKTLKGEDVDDDDLDEEIQVIRNKLSKMGEYDD